MKKKFKIVLSILLVWIMIIVAYGTYYLNDYYHADESSLSLINGTENVSVSKTSNGLYLDGPSNDTALIFYPGAKVEYTSYLPLLMNLSNKGVDCFIVEMPFNLAVLGQNSADDIINNDLYNYDYWYMSGHSLGGSMAASYTTDNSDKIDGLILLASYPTDTVEVPVLSVYGSNDYVLNNENYDNARGYMSNYTEYVIDGGNHAQFASYGNQSGDGIATITGDNQLKQTIDKILEFINKN